jgi:hypothetical protein
MPSTTTHRSNSVTNRSDRPTPAQQSYIRGLAQRTGTSFTPPKTKREASAEIQRLKTLKGRGHTFAEASARPDHGDVPLTNGAAIRASEVTGYGSRASLRAGSEDHYDGLGRFEMWG